MEGAELRATILPRSCSAGIRSVAAPPSKSMAHRMLICAGLADGISTVRGVALSEDILATIDCLRALGAEITETTASGGSTVTLRVKGTDPRTAGSAVLGCRESGSTLRFMIPLAALSGNEMTMTAAGRLMERPLSVYEDMFRAENIRMERNPSGITVSGVLSGGEYVMDGSVSSQFISGMLFTLPLMREDSAIRLLPPVESRPYIDMTISALGTFGVTAEWEGSEDGHASIRIPGGQTYKASDVCVEGDWSNAAFFLAMGHEVTGLREDSLQGDKVCAWYFRELDQGHPELDISACPDLGPVLMAYAAMHSGCTLTGTRRLRIKESDRGSAMKEELAKFGVSVEVSENIIEVGSGVSAPSEILCGHNDHRIVMALAVICAQTGGIIDGAEAVSKSFPDFFDRLAETGTESTRA